MSELKRKIVAEISARDKAKGEMAIFRREFEKTNWTMGQMAQTVLAMVWIDGGLYALQSGLKRSVMVAAKRETP